MTGRELECIRQAHERGALAGSGHFTRLCEDWLENRVGSHKAILTHSCTAALEMTCYSVMVATISSRVGLAQIVCWAVLETILTIHSRVMVWTI